MVKLEAVEETALINETQEPVPTYLSLGFRLLMDRQTHRQNLTEFAIRSETSEKTIAGLIRLSAWLCYPSWNQPWFSKCIILGA